MWPKRCTVGLVRVYSEPRGWSLPIPAAGERVSSGVRSAGRWRSTRRLRACDAEAGESRKEPPRFWVPSRAQIIQVVKSFSEAEDTEPLYTASRAIPYHTAPYTTPHQTTSTMMPWGRPVTGRGPAGCVGVRQQYCPPPFPHPPPTALPVRRAGVLVCVREGACVCLRVVGEGRGSALLLLWGCSPRGPPTRRGLLKGLRHLFCVEEGGY